MSVWESALGAIESKIKRHNFDMWFKPIHCAAIDGDRILLRAPNRYIKEWFEDNYLTTVLEEIRSQTQQDYRIIFEVAEEPARVEAPTYDNIAGEPSAIEPAAVEPHEPAAAATPTRHEGATPPVLHPALLAKYQFDTYVVGPSNQLAHAASRAAAEFPAGKYNPLFVYGGVGLGKTHLIHAIGHHIHASK